MSETIATSQYDRRVELVRNVIRQNSKLNDKAAFDLAVLTLRAIDRIPETVR